MTNDQDPIEKELELEPVEIHEELYSANLFGEKVEVKEEEEGDVVGPKARPEFNVFALTDAIGSRNKREAWVLYHKALASGLVPEELFYKVQWQVKTMLLATKTKTAEEADMKSYPYSKAKGFLKNFKPGELEKLSEDLVRGYHEVRRGNEETETFVEKTLLSL
jgi:DNA polymerase III delta subunit